MNRRQVIVALDAGTSMLKAVAFDIKGEPVAIESRVNNYREAPGGTAEQDMAQTWTDAAATIAALVARLDHAEIVGLAVTGQGDGTWLIDAEGEPAGPALLWLDGRAGRIVERIRASGAGRTLFEQTGTGLAACNQSGQILYLAETHAASLTRATTALHCKDWLYFKLTGERVTDPSEASFTYGSWRTRTYSDATIEALGMQKHRHLLPPIADGVSTHHTLTDAAASLLGLKPGLQVILGYVDVVCSALGAGIFGTDREGGTSIIGSTGMNMRLADDDYHRPVNVPLSGFRMVFPVPGKTAIIQSSLAATLNIDWLQSIANQAVALAGHTPDRAHMLQALDAAVLAAAPAQAIYHPYISAAGERGPFTNALARASLSGFDRSLDLPGMMRSVYEGLALAAADCYAAMGGPPAVVTITGGASRSTTMRGIFAAMINRPVRIVKEHGSGALGAAMIAAVSLGVMPDMETCAQSWVAPLLGEKEPPDPALAALYAPLLPIYQRSRDRMGTLWQEFGQFQEVRHGG